ncbi:MAG: TspO/MBR family protein [Pseudomonadota bacterium]
MTALTPSSSQPTAVQQALGLLTAVLVCFAVSAVGAAASFQARAFYGDLAQPDWAPPGWLFGPVWTVLFLLMAVSVWLVWRAGGFRERPWVAWVFIAQLACNALWSWLFFAWQLGLPALLDIVALWSLIALSIVGFWSITRLAGALLMPYLLWVSFAMALNYFLLELNPAVLG